MRGRALQARALGPVPDTNFVTETNASELPQARCTFCPNLTTNHFPASVAQLPGKPKPDGTAELVRTPPVWLCGECTPRYHQGAVNLGWCGECTAWGSAYSVSPCGDLYMPLG